MNTLRRLGKGGLREFAYKLIRGVCWLLKLGWDRKQRAFGSDFVVYPWLTASGLREHLRKKNESRGNLNSAESRVNRV